MTAQHDWFVVRARRFDRILARHGYLTHRASEVQLMKPCANPKGIGEHARWMCQEIIDGNLSPLQNVRWLGFVKGIMFSLGILTIEELIEHADVEEEF